MLCFTSCWTSTKFTVYGEPGTQIMTPSKDTLATISNTGKVKIANDDGVYYAFLLSHKPGTEEYIPFALDYKKKSYPGAAVVEYGGWMVAIVGGSLILDGLIVSKVSDEDATPFFIGGAAAGIVGSGIGMLGKSRNDQTNHEHRYKYNSVQNTNQDIQFTKPVFELYKPEIPVKQDVKVETTSKANKTLSSSSSTKTLKDNAAKIEGTYIGEGTLKQGNEIIETYNNISISIKKKSKDTVLVNVIESDGSKFFTTDGEYNIKKQSNGKYLLSLKGINNATIEIDTNKKLIYIHPRVNIDGEIYKLNINAKKK